MRPADSLSELQVSALTSRLHEYQDAESTLWSYVDRLVQNGQSATEIAGIIGCSKATVYRRLQLRRIGEL